MKDFWNNIKFAWKYAKEQKGKMLKYIILNTLNMGISIIVPIISANIIIALTANEFEQLIYMAIIIFALDVVGSLISYFSKYYAQVIYRETFTKIQTNLGAEILKLENKTIDENSSGVFIQRLTNDTSKLADIFNALNIYLMNIITDLGIFAAIFIINKVAFVYMVIVTILLYIVERTRVETYTEKDKIFRNKNEKVSGFVGELVRGIRDIKMLNSEESFIDELHNKVIDLNKTRYDMQNVDRNYTLIRYFTRDFAQLFLIILLVILIKRGHIEAASALIIHNYAGRVLSIVNYVGILLDKIKDFNLSASRIFAIINSDGFQKEHFGKKHIERIQGNFEFKDVEFSYDKEKVLDGVSFKIKANETVAFVGKSGAGKSTIFSLLCKMYDISKGKIMIDGVNIQELDRETIRGNITIISQSPYIFNVSIRDNLKLVKPGLTEEEMIEACKMACLHEFIEGLPDGYDTVIGEGGVNLSGGQKQRLAIARALVQKTEIILFDEATSALDNETQTNIQKAIENMKNEYTILIIAHRLSTVINSDRILFLDKGKIQGEGTHKELLKNNTDYRKLYEAEMQKQ